MTRLEGRCVVDTNVVLKLFFEEEHTEQAVTLFRRFESGKVDIAIPDLLIIEFINILWIKLRHGETDRPECRTILARFLDLAAKLKIVAAAALVEEILEASIRHAHPAYDMTFLVLADSLNVPFITADESLCRKLRPQSRAPILLSDLE